MRDLLHVAVAVAIPLLANGLLAKDLPFAQDFVPRVLHLNEELILLTALNFDKDPLIHLNQHNNLLETLHLKRIIF